MDEIATSATVQWKIPSRSWPPRDGLLGYFDQYGDPYTGTNHAVVEPNFINASANEAIDPGLFTMEFDAMEILNAKRLRYPLRDNGRDCVALRHPGLGLHLRTPGSNH